MSIIKYERDALSGTVSKCLMDIQEGVVMYKSEC